MLETVKSMDAAALETIQGYEGVTVYTLSPEERVYGGRRPSRFGSAGLTR